MGLTLRRPFLPFIEFRIGGDAGPESAKRTKADIDQVTVTICAALRVGSRWVEQRLRLLQTARVKRSAEPALQGRGLGREPAAACLESARAVRRIAVPTKVGNTNNDAATNGQSLHTRRRWFVAKSPSWRFRIRSWTPRGSPPKEAAGRRVKHKKMQVGEALSRRARALAQLHWAHGIGSWRACCMRQADHQPKN